MIAKKKCRQGDVAPKTAKMMEGIPIYIVRKCTKIVKPVLISYTPHDPCPKCGEPFHVIWNGKPHCLECNFPPIGGITYNGN